MQIERLTRARLDGFYQFNQAIDPIRNDFVERFEFMVLRHPRIAEATDLPVVIAVDETGQIIGQHLHQPCQYYWRGTQSDGYYGYDFYVQEGLRGRGIGKALAKAASQQFYPHFGVGVAKASQKILIDLGNRTIGSLFVYLWIRNWLSPVKFAMDKLNLRNPSLASAQVRQNRFPERIRIGNFRFRLITVLAEWHDEYWDPDTLEFARSLEFLQWRFLMHPNRYYFYLLEEPNATAYVVLRKIEAKGLCLLGMIDYRVPKNDALRWAAVIRLAKQLARLGRFDGILTMSSHRFFDAMLKRKAFWRVGKPIVILTNAQIEIEPDRVDQRTAVFATMADSDLDFFFQF